MKLLSAITEMLAPAKIPKNVGVPARLDYLWYN
jgi:hypothetical protein